MAVLALGVVLASCEVIAAGTGAAGSETVWIRMVPSVAVGGKATLVLDLSRAIPGLTKETSKAELGALFTFKYADGSYGAEKITPTGITQDSVAVYTLTVENVPDDEKGAVLVTINKAGITPPTRAWSLNNISLSRTGDGSILDDANPYNCEAVIGYLPPPLGVTITNLCTTPTGVLQVALSGDNAAQFTLTSSSLTSIALGGAVENAFAVQPVAGLPLGDYTAVVTVSGGNGIKQNFTVSFAVRLPHTESAEAATGGGDDAYSEFMAVAKDTEGCTYAVGMQSAGTYSYGANVSITKSLVYGNAVIVKYDNAGAALWAKSPQVLDGEDGQGGSIFLGVAVDGSGNVYAVGNQMDVLGYDYGNGVTGTGSASGPNNVSIVKYNRDGEAQWAKSTVGGDGGQFNAVAPDDRGNVYAVGWQSSINPHNYGGSAIAASTGMNGGAVIVKYKSDTGAALWASAPIADDGDSMLNMAIFNGIVADALGNVYVAGHQDGTYTYEYGGAQATGVKAGQFGSNAVLVKYDGNSVGCKALWAKTVVSGDNISSFRALAADGLGNLYAAGNQHGDGTFNYGGASAAAGVTGWGYNAVIVKYDGGNGAALWAKSVNGGNNNSDFFGVTADVLGNVYAVGCQTGSSPFDYGTASATGSYNSDTSVIVKYDSRGGDEAAVWAHAVQGGAFTRLHSIAADGRGGFSAVGTQNRGTIDYGNGAPLTATAEVGTAVMVRYR
jgi:hypothetical protein